MYNPTGLYFQTLSSMGSVVFYPFNMMPLISWPIQVAFALTFIYILFQQLQYRGFTLILLPRPHFHVNVRKAVFCNVVISHPAALFYRLMYSKPLLIRINWVEVILNNRQSGLMKQKIILKVKELENRWKIS
jgi:hypothetical protein